MKTSNFISNIQPRLEKFVHNNLSAHAFKSTQRNIAGLADRFLKSKGIIFNMEYLREDFPGTHSIASLQA